MSDWGLNSSNMVMAGNGFRKNGDSSQEEGSTDIVETHCR